MVDYAALRREYGERAFGEETAHASPFIQFQQWFEEAKASAEPDPNAMVLSTVDAEGAPDARIVLLKGLEDDAFVFYTNYLSVKAQEIAQEPRVALTFFWANLSRQVRIRGFAKQVSAELSDTYFASRPYMSQVGAWASAQSALIDSRTTLEKQLADMMMHFQTESMHRPPHWGGYAVSPSVIEFWQGRDNRLHDRIQYVLQDGAWKKQRLSP